MVIKLLECLEDTKDYHEVNQHMSVPKSIKTIILSLIIFISYSVHAQKKTGPLDPVTIAKSHGLRSTKPSPDFFDGALLGNGGMGVVVTTRPDAIVLRFGHNNVWDIRISERNREKIGTFDSIFNKIDALPKTLASLTDDPWYSDYNRMTGENYAKGYPRPFPCGSLVLGFDRRKLSMLGHELDISNGLCRVRLMNREKKIIYLNIFTDMLEDRLWMELVDEKGVPQLNPFERVKVIADPSTPTSFPNPELTEDLTSGLIGFRQILPKAEQEPGSDFVGHAKDRAFSLMLKVNQQVYKKARLSWNGNSEPMPPLEAALSNGKPFIASIKLQEGFNTKVAHKIIGGGDINHQTLSRSFENNVRIWNAYWNKSCVSLSDQFLEEIWYRNLYFFNCATKPEATCPGLFANWSYDNIGTAWHGDYHMNYNTQQPFWLTFSSNHLEKNLSYVNLIESLMPVSRKWASEYYHLPGAYFPHSAYPVEMEMNPYPIPDWGWEVSETPWAVQGLWWHYLYSGDNEFLKKRAYEPIKAAVEFLAAYMSRKDAHGAPRWQDGKFHIFPSVPPELYGLRPGFKYNYDSNVDLSLTKFTFNAFKQAVKILDRQQSEKKLIEQIEKIQASFPQYPSSRSPEYGKIMVSVPEEHSEVVYNVPNALFAVFPGEDFGLGSDSATLRTFRNTYKNQRNEGGNDLVFGNFQAARLGILDLDEFKRQINYCLLGNGTATDMVIQTGGRYGDGTSFDYMSRMGIWFENFALPAVINECLVQGYNGNIRLFPNWPKNKDASFSNLRVAGAFLVSAAKRGRAVKSVEIYSEKGGILRITLPWKRSYLGIGGVRKLITNPIFNTPTSIGQKLIFSNADI